jgi:large subunit ribosomal protein L2
MTKQLKRLLRKKSGRDSMGHVSVRHQGGRVKRFLRQIDFKRDKKDIVGKVEAIEHDPNRNAKIALVVYKDGERRYILSPLGMAVGNKVIASDLAPLEMGNALPLKSILPGTQIHNIEIVPGKGGQLVKSAGSVAVVQSREGNVVLVKLPSGEVRKFRGDAWATVGQIGNIEVSKRRIRKAGTKRKMGIRPSVRGVAMHPGAHPHGGGEGRSGIGLPFPKTPWGKPAVGKTRKHNKYSDNLIISGRKKGPHVG